MANKTKTVTLTEFLLARIDEDKQDAQDAITHERALLEIKPHWEVVYAWAMMLNNPGHGGSHNFQPGAPSPHRVLAECEAKRQIVEQYERTMTMRREHRDDLATAGALLALLGAMNSLTLPYVDHPDYREWAV